MNNVLTRGTQVHGMVGFFRFVSHLRYCSSSRPEVPLTNTSPGSPPQKGLTTYTLSANRQRPLKGAAHAAVFNTWRRFRGQVHCPLLPRTLPMGILMDCIGSLRCPPVCLRLSCYGMGREKVGCRIFCRYWHIGWLTDSNHRNHFLSSKEGRALYGNEEE